MKPYYQDSAVTIYHGDCREILPTLERVDLVLTDPPYIHKHTDGGGFAAKANFYKMRQLDGLSAFVPELYIPLISKIAPSQVYFHSRDLVEWYASYAKSNGFSYDLHFWHKENAVPFCKNTFKSDVEYIAILYSAGRHFVNGLGQERYSKVYRSPIFNTNKVHPTEKPIELMCKYITILTSIDYVILDPFMGSGTTLRAAKDLNRKAVGIEINEQYCEIAASRMSQEVLAL